MGRGRTRQNENGREREVIAWESGGVVRQGVKRQRLRAREGVCPGRLLAPDIAVSFRRCRAVEENARRRLSSL
jgi:hypothetical protein